MTFNASYTKPTDTAPVHLSALAASVSKKFDLELDPWPSDLQVTAWQGPATGYRSTEFGAHWMCTVPASWADSPADRPRCGTAMVHWEFPIVESPPLVSMECPLFAPEISPSRWRIPKPHYLPHPWPRPTYHAKRHPDLIRHFSTIHWTDTQTNRS